MMLPGVESAPDVIYFFTKRASNPESSLSVTARHTHAYTFEVNFYLYPIMGKYA